MTGRKTFAVVAAGGGVVVLAVVLGLLLDLKIDGWTLVAAITAAIATLVGVGFAYVEVQNAKKRSRIDRTLDLTNIILGHDSIRATIAGSEIRAKLDELPEDERFAAFQKLKSTDDFNRLRRAQVLFLLNIYERVAFLYKMHLLDRPLARTSFETKLVNELDHWRLVVDALREEARLQEVPNDRLPYCELIWLSDRWKKDKGGKT